MKKVANPKKSRKHIKPSSEPPPAPITAPFALTSDGQGLINVAACDERHLKRRARFEAVVMTPDEAALAAETLTNAAFDAAAKVGGRMASITSPPKPAEPRTSRPIKRRTKA